MIAVGASLWHEAIYGRRMAPQPPTGPSIDSFRISPRSVRAGGTNLTFEWTASNVPAGATWRLQGKVGPGSFRNYSISITNARDVRYHVNFEAEWRLQLISSTNHLLDETEYTRIPLLSDSPAARAFSDGFAAGYA